MTELWEAAAFAGVDLAAEPGRTGFARLQRTPQGRLVVEHAGCGLGDEELSEMLSGVAKAGIDVPFGWPAGFADFLADHAVQQHVAPMAADVQWRRGMVLRRTDRDRFAHRVDTASPAHGQDRGEVMLPQGFAEAGAVQEEMIITAALQLGVHGRCHHVAWRKISQRVPPGHHQASGAIDQPRSLAADFRAAGYEFCLRYVGRTQMASYDLTAQEANDILDAGLALMPVQHVLDPGWQPTQALGAEYGANAAAFAQAIGFPPGVNVWCDLESVAESAAASDVAAYCNAWYVDEGPLKVDGSRVTCSFPSMPPIVLYTVAS